jgi:hypothetical protein
MSKNYDEIEDDKYLDLMAHFDFIITELDRLREEVSAAMISPEEANAFVKDFDEQHREGSEATPEGTTVEAPGEDDAPSSVEEEEEEDGDPSSMEQEDPVLMDEAEATPEEEKLSEATASVDPILEEKVPELTLETAFEPLIDFSTQGHLSVADSFFFANELFLGNRPQLETTLSEVDRLSSMTQLRHYLYDTLRLDEEDEAVQRFYDFIVAHSSRR